MGLGLPQHLTELHNKVVACCRVAGFTPHAQHLASSITSQLAIVTCGLGVALVPESATQGSERSGLTRPFSLPRIDDDRSSRRMATQTAAHQQILDSIHK